jgi:DNA-binding NarL/FixJ family response regulator
MAVRVMIVDDQPLVRAGFKAILEREADIVVVAEAANGLEALQLAEGAAVDVLVMDLRMPVLDGVEATRQLLAQRGGEAPKVIIITTFDLDEYVFEALRVGASGFLLKDVQPPDLVAAVRTVAGGEAILSPQITRRLLDEFATSMPALPTPPGMANLTERELDVFRLIARGKSNSEIGSDLFLGQNTVKTHVSRVLAKLGVRHRTEAVVLAYEIGFVRPGDAAHEPPDTR